MKLIGVAEVPEVFAIDDMSLVSYCDAASRKDAILYCVVKEVINLGPIWSRHTGNHQKSQQIMHQHCLCL